MTVIVITPPDPIVTPDDISGVTNLSVEMIEALIAASTEEIDGPSGWLGRALGPQMLELQLADFPCSGTIDLQCPPVIGIEDITYLDHDGADQLIDPPDYGLIREIGCLYLRTGKSWPSARCEPASIRIRYQAGYDGVPVADGGTGNVPERARQAIILSVRELTSAGAENLFLRVDEVDGIGRQEFTVSDAAGAVIAKTVQRLLGGLRVFR